MSRLKTWVSPARTALLLIDMQVDFALAEGAMGREGKDMSTVAAAVRNGVLMADAARRAGVPCLFARLITRPGEESAMLREWKKRRGHDPLLCREGTIGAEFVGPKPLAGERVFSKSRYNAFSGTGLDAHLRETHRDTLVIAGLTTECCIDAAARDAFERDYHVFIAADAVAAYEPELHRAALHAMELNCAIMAQAADLLAAWEDP
ncbi:MAG: cysteine hydrolase [Rhizomicrobium sp.]